MGCAFPVAEGRMAASSPRCGRIRQTSSHGATALIVRSGSARAAQHVRMRSHRFEARMVGVDGSVARMRADTPGAAARLVHDHVWAGGECGEVWRRGRHGELLTTMRRVATRAISVTNHVVGTTQYEYNPTTARPQERHWSKVWPPQGIPYWEGNGIG